MSKEQVGLLSEMTMVVLYAFKFLRHLDKNNMWKERVLTGRCFPSFSRTTSHAKKGFNLLSPHEINISK